MVLFSKEHKRSIIRTIIVPQTRFRFKTVIRDLPIHIFIQNQLIVGLQHFRPHHQFILMNGIQRTGKLVLQPMSNAAIMNLTDKHDVRLRQRSNQFVISNLLAVRIKQGIRFLIAFLGKGCRSYQT